MEQQGEIILYHPDKEVKLATVAKFATVQSEGGRTVARQIEYYNLDMILSVGYRVKGKKVFAFSKLDIPPKTITDLL